MVSQASQGLKSLSSLGSALLCYDYDAAASITDSGMCEDNNSQCSIWALRGECSKNPRYMLYHCKASCGVCKGAKKVFLSAPKNTPVTPPPLPPSPPPPLCPPGFLIIGFFSRF